MGHFFLNSMEIIPRFMSLRRDEIIAAAHQATGHGGVMSTFKKLRESYLGIKEDDVRSYVSTCRTCALYNSQPAPCGTICTIEADQPWQHLEVDLVDLRFCADSNNGFCWLLTCLDHFSRFAIVLPLRSKTKNEVSLALWGVFYT